mgnify:CR=1 FL=1
MNERIQELAEEAGFDLTPTANMLYTVRGNHAQLERYAKLIVRECADLCSATAAGQDAEAIEAAILEHFGVGE